MMNKNEKTVRVTVGNKTLDVPAGQFLSEILSTEKPCGGHGKCGKCRVTVRGKLSEPTEAERRLLTKEEMARGVRLSCQTRAIGDCEIVTAEKDRFDRIVTNGVLPNVDPDPAFSRYGAAIDIGTTALAARLFDPKGNLLAEASELNPQSVYGADVISRIEASLDGKREKLASLIRGALDRLLYNLSFQAGILSEEIDGVVITGNTVMLTLLTGDSVEPFSRMPFNVGRLFGEELTAKELGLEATAADAVILLPPCVSAFVGADITCAILASRLTERKTAFLADVGTNGEMALWQGGKLTVCSTAAGPAFEGVGISMGMRGSDGAIDKVTLNGDKPVAHVIGDGSPVGICGSGLVDAAACMLDAEILEESGYLEAPYAIADSVALTPKDLRMLQLAKSAICAGLMTLLDDAGIAPDDVDDVYIAGGFGYYLNADNAAKIGLLPRGIAQKAEAIGNAALGGASLLLLNKDLHEACGQIANSARVLDLSTSSVFAEYYLTGMTFCEV